MKKSSKIYIAGHTGLVGSAIVRELTRLGFNNLLLIPRSTLNLGDDSQTLNMMGRERPEYVFMAAGRVGGIEANRSEPVQFLTANLDMVRNVTYAAHQTGVKKLLFLGSSCIYPRMAAQPIKESELLAGHLEPTNEAYAIAKIAGIKLCQAYRRQYGCDFISAMPCNLYGPNDNYDEQGSHVLPAMIRRFHTAKKDRMKAVECWGDGSPLREFLYVDDLADACVQLMNEYSSEEIINVGSGEETSIRELAEMVAAIVGYCGELRWDTTKPNGTPRKVLDNSRIYKMGWAPKVSLSEGLRRTYEDYKKV